MLALLGITALIVLSIYAFFPKEIQAIKDRDPAAKNSFEIIILYSGLHAIVGYRIAHAIYNAGIPFVPRFISQLMRFLTGIEIHPGAKIGSGFFIDHGTGVVIGETTIIGHNVTLFQGVTLGGTGKETGKRHPTIGNNVVVGAGAKVLGNIEVGNNSYVGANAVVIRSVPKNATVVGVPAHIAKQDGERLDIDMDHVHVSDPIMQNFAKLLRRIKNLESQVSEHEEEEGSGI